MAASLPAAPQMMPGLPESADFFDFQGFNGMDTQPPRPGVANDKCSWLDNIFPIGPNNMRAMPDCGAAFLTAGRSLTIIHFDFFGLQVSGVSTGPCVAVFFSDGSAIQATIPGNVHTTIAGPGTFSPPANTAIATRQYGTQYLLIATVQTNNSYWVWDGVNLYTAGTVGPEINITDDGTGYTSAPTIGIVGGSGAGATFSSTVSNGSVATIAVTAAGSGWHGNDATESLLTFTGGGSGTTAYGVASAVNGAIVAIEIVNGGHSFTSIPAIVITDGSGSGAQAVVTGIQGGSITAVTVIDCGQNYSSSPTISTSGGGGSGATFAATLQSGVINSVVMTVGGSGYISRPSVRFLCATGSGAQGTAVLSGTGIAGVDFGFGIGNGFSGAGYTGNILVIFEGGGGPASATVRLMPFGVHGFAIETYQGRVWISDILMVVKVFFSAPDSVVNFGTPDGGGVFPATESTLRYQYTNLVASNSFLYLIGDSDVNYISGVQTSGSPATTTFSNLNVDPQIGSPWRDSVQVYSRAVMFANPRGVFELNGSAVRMVSTPLDGIFNTANQTATVLNNPSSAVAQIFSIHVYMLLLPILDPITGLLRNALLCWDGKKWWAASQHVTLTKIATQEWGSQINAWGTDGVSIYQLFTTPSTSTGKTLQSRLSFAPSIMESKKPLQIYAFWQSIIASALLFYIDTEKGSTLVTQGGFAGGTGTITFARSNVGTVDGTAIGFHITSTSADFIIMAITLMFQHRRLRV